MRVSRETFLNQLESVQPGLSPKEIIEQSSCVVFKGGKMITYNDEIACTHDSVVDVEGAVQAVPLISLLRKLSEEFVEVDASNGEFLVKGKGGRKSGIRMERDVLLPIETVEIPKKWKPMDEDFAEAVGIVGLCAGTDESQFALTCIHLHPEFVEACDDYQLSRFPLKTGVKSSTLVRQESIKHIVSLGMTEMSETETWIHFKNEVGLVLSCRRTLEGFPPLDKILSTKGSRIVLPKGLTQAAEKAEIFSAENETQNQVMVQLRQGRLRIRGQGPSGWYSEIKKIKYSGQPIQFSIAPRMLADIVQHHNECEITEKQLVARTGKYTYVSCLGTE